MPAQSLHHWLAGSPSPLPTPTATSGCKEDRSNLGLHCGRGGAHKQVRLLDTFVGLLRLRGETQDFPKKITLT